MPTARSASFISELHAKSELDHAGRTGRGDAARSDRIDLLVRQTEVGAIGYIEHFPAKLRLGALPQGEPLAQREIESHEAGAVQDVPSRVAESESAVRHNLERR